MLENQPVYTVVKLLVIPAFRQPAFLQEAISKVSGDFKDHALGIFAQPWIAVSSSLSSQSRASASSAIGLRRDTQDHRRLLFGVRRTKQLQLPARFKAQFERRAFEQSEFRKCSSRGSAALDDAPSPAPESDKLGLHWRRALTEAATFLVIEQAYVVHTTSDGWHPETEFRSITIGATICSRLLHGGMPGARGENPLYNYLGHPIQGAITSYIEINNDSRYSTLEFSNSKAYWKTAESHNLQHGLQHTVSIGLLSEPTVEKYGSKDRAPWNANGTYRANTCYSGVGKVNLATDFLLGAGRRYFGQEGCGTLYKPSDRFPD